MLGFQAAALVLAYLGQIYYGTDAATESRSSELDLPKRLNFKTSRDLETALNNQINLEYSAMYAYDMMAAYFDNVQTSMPGCSQFFLLNSNEEHEHARVFITYMNLKGLLVNLRDIKVPTQTTWRSCLEAMEYALALENRVRQSLDDLNKKASGADASGADEDVALTELLGEMIMDQTSSIKRLGDIISQFIRVGREDNLGHFLIDQSLQKNLNSVSTPGLAPMPLDALSPRKDAEGVAGRAFK